MYGLSVGFLRYLRALSDRMDGANGLNQSLCFRRRLILSFVFSSCGGARTDLAPSDLGPHSILPWNHPIILPLLTSSAASPDGSWVFLILRFLCFFRVASISSLAYSGPRYALFSLFDSAFSPVSSWCASRAAPMDAPASPGFG